MLEECVEEYIITVRWEKSHYTVLFFGVYYIYSLALSSKSKFDSEAYYAAEKASAHRLSKMHSSKQRASKYTHAKPIRRPFREKYYTQSAS